MKYIIVLISLLLTGCPGGDIVKEADEGILSLGKERVCIKSHENEVLFSYTVIYISTPQEKSVSKYDKDLHSACIDNDLLKRNGKYVVNYTTKKYDGIIHYYSVAFWIDR